MAGIPPHSLAVARSFVVAGCDKHPLDACRSLTTPRSADLRLSSLPPVRFLSRFARINKNTEQSSVFLFTARAVGIPPSPAAGKRRAHLSRPAAKSSLFGRSYRRFPFRSSFRSCSRLARRLFASPVAKRQ